MPVDERCHADVVRLHGKHLRHGVAIRFKADEVTSGVATIKGVSAWEPPPPLYRVNPTVMVASADTYAPVR